MQELSTPETPENASAEPGDIIDMLLTAEGKVIGLHTMATALSELLDGDLTKDLAQTRRKMSAAFQAAWAIEDMADGALKTIHVALDVGYATRTDTPKLDKAAEAMRTAIIDGLAPGDQNQKVGGFALTSSCTRDLMIDFTDDLLSIIDELSVARLAVTNTDWLALEDMDSIGIVLDRSHARAKALRVRMNNCIDAETGSPPRRHARAAEAGSA
ncbi:hypothetical protein IHQ71_26625 [Rhizobium sp. TH2]|uniref:hypothetical protein n=1 Tax=Rhizobium sp. TH2 TaxID=2775403 RepID=UPI002157880A|nr:hypothetical protein [Rhizobium sp. TH2]UVC08661.1 hypothetical protein IHQ71_26625 [Rhizobium sp. TH2]